jgi:tetratricopeptide (TPR) repeat protein
VGDVSIDATVLLVPLSLALAAACLAAPAKAEDLPDLGSLWDFSDPAATEARFREVLPKAEAAGDAEYLARLLTQVARAQGLQQKFADAHVTLDRAEAALPKDRPAVRVLCLLERGRVHNSSQEPEKAKPLFRSAFDLASEAKADALAVDAAHMLAIVETGQASDEWNEKALATADASTDPKARRWRWALHNNLGWSAFARKEYAKAIASHEKALAAATEGKNVGSARVSRWSVAKAQRMLGRVDEALATQRALLAEYEAEKEEDGYVFEEMGECLHALGKAEEARPHFRRAHEILSKDLFLVRDESERLERLRRLGGE